MYTNLKTPVSQHYMRRAPIDTWHIPPALFASLVLLMAAAKKKKRSLLRLALVAGT
jgi:hypothetical protein